MRGDRLPADIAAVALLTLLANAVALAPVLRETPLRPVLGVAFVLFAPGYVLVAALFPPGEGAATDESEAATGLTGSERLALSIGVSAVVSPLVGLALTPLAGVRLVPLLFALTAVTAAGAVVAVRRRPETDRSSADIRLHRVTAPFTDEDAPNRALNVAFAVLVVASVVGGGYAVLESPGDEPFSELYLDGAAEFPETTSVGQTDPLTLGVRNNAERARTYTVVVAVQRTTAPTESAQFEEDVLSSQPQTTVDVESQTELERYTATVAPGDTWERTHAVTPPFAGEHVRLLVLLYEGEAPANPALDSADRETHLWLTVTEEG
ncbi:DUF1616 domain-containing protein [Haloplanus sp. C73]|uniref:DUF1616 domain-containing protein n=1 Tax=Haloplanus sp. C73 TaxID=3421641 RepID=UPI003EC103D1